MAQAIIKPKSLLNNLLYRKKKFFSTNSQKICQNLVQVYTPSINSVLKNDVNNNKLNPWFFFVTGFTYVEGCFGLYIYKNAIYKTGWFISLVFKISLHEKDKLY